MTFMYAESQEQSQAAASLDTSLAKMFEVTGLNLILVRHGQAGGNGRYGDWDGAALSKVGEQQAAKLAGRLAAVPLDCIYTSNLARSYQTGEAVSACHPKVPFRSVPEIREISGTQLRNRRQARTRLARAELHEQRERVARFAKHLRQEHQDGQVVAIVGHNGLNGMLLAELTGIAYRQSICWVSYHTGVSFANVDLDSSTVLLRLMGCTRHLPPDLITNDNIHVAAQLDSPEASVWKAWRK